MNQQSRRRFIGSLAAASAAGAIAPPALLQARPRKTTDADVSALYAAAKKEGLVVWWTAQHTQATAEALRLAFTAKYPGVDVQFIRQGGGVIYQRLTQGMKSGVIECDVFATSDEAHCVTLKSNNALAEFVPLDHDKVLPDFRNLDPDGTYHMGVVEFVLTNYQEKKVSAPPKKWADFLDPRYKGQISMAHPGFSGSFATFCVAMQDKYGWEYFKALEKNAPKINRSLYDAVTDIMAGERLIGIGPYDLALDKRAAGAPIAIDFPSDDAIMVVQPTAVLKNAPHPNAARLFANFYDSREYSETLKKSWMYPIRIDVGPADGRKLATLKYYRNKPERLVAMVPEITAKWRETFGV